jgi:hypothetical protein
MTTDLTDPFVDLDQYKLLPIRDVQKWLGISLPVLYLKIRAGELEARKVGALTFIPRQSLLDYIRELPPLSPKRVAVQGELARVTRRPAVPTPTPAVRRALVSPPVQAPAPVGLVLPKPVVMPVRRRSQSQG